MAEAADRKAAAARNKAAAQAEAEAALEQLGCSDEQELIAIAKALSLSDGVAATPAAHISTHGVPVEGAPTVNTHTQFSDSDDDDSDGSSGDGGGGHAANTHVRIPGSDDDDSDDSSCEQTECEAGCILWYGECGAMTRNGQCVIILLWRGCQGFGALAAIKLSDTPWFSSSCRQVKWGCGLDSGKGICAVYSRRLWSQATAEILDLALCLY